MEKKTYQGKSQQQKPLFKQLRGQVLPIREGDSAGKRMAKNIGFVLFCIFFLALTAALGAAAVVAA
ncbi:hypothetical protein H8S90_11650 [Olivibacter sp. SDN3]|uniref:hypothetical protein n=1 Tax=Olivibacter sp. SDN3 TaxID=2764720 RepID=UPI001650FF99|nr:hypothetical protein [Olivibacter sp. SDN3]QNL52169.1 hypothetical protein H8S90_11650 [Olivibacter sp. SDN3]